MVFNDIDVLTETSAPKFVAAGGKIGYEMIRTKDGEPRWQIIGTRPDGTNVHCIVPGTGKRKIYATLDALAKFTMRCQPAVGVIEIPLKTVEELAAETQQEALAG